MLGSDFVDYKAEFSTAQSVTPGQGQTVQIAGVDVGEITKVELVDGRAVVTMKIRRKYTPIYKDATALLRPKTGLNDMILELTRARRRPGKAPPGWTIPVARRCPTSTSTRSSSSLDGDTRDYLQLLVAAGGQGLDGEGKNLSADAQALRADRQVPGQAQRRAGRARREHPPLDPQLPPAGRGARRQGRPAGPARRLLQRASSRPSPTRTPACARRCSCCPAR